MTVSVRRGLDQWEVVLNYLGNSIVLAERKTQEEAWHYAREYAANKRF